MKILCVAEKPSIAKAVANHLAGSHVRANNVPGTPYVKNYNFQYNFPRWGECEVTMTSVLGHLYSQDFGPDCRSWNSCDPSALFEAQIHMYHDEKNKPIAKNIETQGRYSQALFIWTDCDREGEYIGTEVRKVAAKDNPRLTNPANVVRARFSNIERQHIVQAARNPVTLDEQQAQAVWARMELDFRIGASFTRLQTLKFKSWILARGISEEHLGLISYGSCQFPTLGFVVDRYFTVTNFVPEPFWSIKVMHRKDDIQVKFNWARDHLFDRMLVTLLFERCIAAKYAKVTRVQTKPTSKWKPLPLTTLELQKMGSRYLRMDSQRVMNLAEGLYNKGWISYPRTETDQFDRGMDLRALVQKQTQGPAWGQYAQSLLDGAFSQPRSGRNNDKAHPPIHPVNFVMPTQLNDDERRVHEFVVRHFLACCSEDAKGTRDEVSILYGSEVFNASGLAVRQRNYLDIYPYHKWTSTQQLPPFEVGETFEPTEARLHEGKTSPPGFLTEPDLLALMDANGIGTDATMAEHIQTIRARKYVDVRERGRAPRRNDDDDDDDDGEEEGEAPITHGGGGRGRGRGRGRGGRGGAQPNGRGSGGPGAEEFIPTRLGVALVKGYEDMGFETSLSKPFLRKEMEVKMKAICDGQTSRMAVVQESLDMYRDVYVRTNRHLNVMKAAIDRYVAPG